MERTTRWALIGLWLVAIAAANVLAAHLGPWATVADAFLLIGLVVTTRDALHTAWGSGWAPRMALLILAGGALSWMVNGAAGRIAAASTIAFVVSETADALVFWRLRSRPWMDRVNASNVAAAIIDSFLFPTIAFGALLPWIIAGQIVAKIGGGYVWALILGRAARDPARHDGAAHAEGAA